MSALEVVLVLFAVTVVGMAAYTLLLGGDRRQSRIETGRTEALEHITAPGAADLDPTHVGTARSSRS